MSVCEHCHSGLSGVDPIVYAAVVGLAVAFVVAVVLYELVYQAYGRSV